MISRSILNCLSKFNKCVLLNETKCGLNGDLRPTWSQVRRYAENKQGKREIIRLSDFQRIDEKSKDNYIQMVNIYKNNEIQRRGHVEFIYTALKHMKEFGVEKDLEVYKALIDVLPKGKMVPRNMFQVEFMHYPKQQQCAIDLLEQMEDNGVMPDWEMEDQLVNVFGRKGYPVRRYWRMMYWMPKLKNASPWPLPLVMTNDAYQLAQLAITRITSVDVNTEITTYKTSDVEGSLEDTWIVSGQSMDQKLLLEELSDNTPLYIDGRHRIWLRNKAVTYFVLRADIFTKEEPIKKDEYDDVTNLKNPLFTKPAMLKTKKKTVHEQEDGMILAVCSTGTSSRDSLLSWVRSLEKSNPRMKKLPIVFTLKAPPEEEESLFIEENEIKNKHEKETKNRDKQTKHKNE